MLVIAFVCVGVIATRAEAIRVTTCSLGGLANGRSNELSGGAAESELIRKAAEALNETDSDVIVLRGVPSRPICKRIAEQLNGEAFGVVICSEFDGESDIVSSPRQLAILSRRPAFASWSESWNSDGATNLLGGFAFAGIQFTDGDICIYAVELAKNRAAALAESAREGGVQDFRPSLRQLVRHAAAVDNRANDRPRAFVITGGVNTPSIGSLPARRDLMGILEESGFQGGLESQSSPGSVGQTIANGSPDMVSDFVFFRNTVFAAQPRAIPSGPGDSSLVTYSFLVGPSSIPTAVGLRHALPAFDQSFERVWSQVLWLALAAAVIVFTFLLGRRLIGLASAQRSSQQLRPNANFSTAMTRTAYVNRLAEDASSGGQVTQAPTETASSDVPLWRQRALEAERQADQAKAVARERLMPHLARMMKDKLLWRLLAQRSQTIRIHDASAKVLAELEQRLVLIQSHFESRVQSYENRIAELERELAAKESITRELLESRVRVARMAVEQVLPVRPKPSVVYTLRFGDLMARKGSVGTQPRQEPDFTSS